MNDDEFFRTAMMLTASLILLGSCGKDEAASGGANEFTVDGKTYQIGETIWMEQIGMITHSEDAKEHFSLTLPDLVEVVSFKVGTTNSTTITIIRVISQTVCFILIYAKV